MNFDLSLLPWLPPAPESFRRLCREIDGAPANGAHALRALSQHSLNESQLNVLARTLGEVREKQGGQIAGLQPFKLGLVSNATTKLIAPSLCASALRYGVDLRIVEAEFNQVMQAATESDSKVIKSEPNAILLALDHRAYEDLQFGITGSVENAVAYFNTLRDAFRQRYKGTLIFQTVACPPEQLFGSLDAKLELTQRGRIQRFNQDVGETLRQSPDVIFDVCGLAQNLGVQNWFNAAQWHIAKLPFAQQYVPIYADYCARIIGALVGKSRKCLVLDLDNTLWGGVIGDDGLDGIVLGQGSAEGEAFLAVQQMALDLRDRGIMLAISSKNDERVARSAFAEHPEMLLREEHISVFQANWTDKASNLEAVAKALNIGLDALVFVDDNPVERGQVRQALPQVAVPELGEDPALYPHYVMGAGYFEAVAFLDEDRQRAAQYQANAQRASLQSQARDLNSYLKSLNMVMTIGPFDNAGRSRITQLINKSNQFNLTTRRYTEADIEQLGGNSDVLTYQVRLADSYGDNGMISVIIARADGVGWTVDTWLMSCRVLGRGVEQAVLNELVARVQQSGGKELIGIYRPSGRNDMVADHYRKLGFAQVETKPDGSSVWSLELINYQPKDVPMAIKRAGTVD
ncbi:HAD-IIIC family phosphatase [Bradyrhizobium sp. B124]|uniref:HAD-IIIC family phosphatase n=1 Tax=Bradyrhizobium sp. B124 TaxID=3140245 RepID=UPI003183115B